MNFSLRVYIKKITKISVNIFKETVLPVNQVSILENNSKEGASGRPGRLLERCAALIPVLYKAIFFDERGFFDSDV